MNILQKWKLQKIFSPVRMLETQLALTYVFCFMWWLEDVIFSKSLSLLWNFFNHHIVVLFETSLLKEVHILRSPYLHNNSAVLILMLMLSSKIKLYYTMLKYARKSFIVDFFMIFFALFIFDCFTLFFKNKFFWKTKKISESLFLHNSVEFL